MLQRLVMSMSGMYLNKDYLHELKSLNIIAVMYCVSEDGLIYDCVIYLYLKYKI